MQHQLSHSATYISDRSQHLLMLLDQYKNYSSGIWFISDQTSCFHFSLMASPLVLLSRVPAPLYVPPKHTVKNSCVTTDTLFYLLSHIALLCTHFFSGLDRVLFTMICTALKGLPPAPPRSIFWSVLMLWSTEGV